MVAVVPAPGVRAVQLAELSKAHGASSLPVCQSLRRGFARGTPNPK
jgi:hypothetical protein